MVIANVIVYKVARRHAIQIDALKQTASSDKMRYPDSVSERQYAAIIVFVKIVTAILCLQTPIIVTMIISTSYPDLRDQTPMRVFRSLAYLCFLINSFVNLYMYIWKLKECEMNLYYMLAKFFKQYKSRAEVLRLEVYNIVVSSQADTYV
ncbi:uncharacterized protein LOC128556566 [Mercenaria mercenaria]|uniref:uncharacterized protein LOC128556566 n=1 Tax=Mercenaria mercenaria TaxID=6596 RepID=UPI00234F293D|nr:uncharacterized protein LOC128556566 [Mercenaria mercenaria]